MKEFDISTMKLFLKEVSDACKKTDMCKDCPFVVIIKGPGIEGFDCRISREPYMWFFEEGAEDGKID